MSKLTMMFLAVLLLLGFVSTDLATAKPNRSARPLNVEKVSARTVKQLTRSTENAISVIERIEELGIARIDKLYESGKEAQAERFENQIVRAITRMSEMTIKRMEMFKNRTIPYLERAGEYELIAELEFELEQLVEILVLETEESIAAVTGEAAPETDPEETEPEEMDPE